MNEQVYQKALVTPYAGVWIEIGVNITAVTPQFVTPYAGVWIEINAVAIELYFNYVTPYAGVWIEILQMKSI